MVEMILREALALPTEARAALAGSLLDSLDTEVDEDAEAAPGHPTIMLLLFTPDDQLVYCDELGAELPGLTPPIVSRQVQGPFLGYLQAQKQRLTALAW